MHLVGPIRVCKTTPTQSLLCSQANLAVLESAAFLGELKRLGGAVRLL